MKTNLLLALIGLATVSGLQVNKHHSQKPADLIQTVNAPNPNNGTATTTNAFAAKQDQKATAKKEDNKTDKKEEKKDEKKKDLLDIDAMLKDAFPPKKEKKSAKKEDKSDVQVDLDETSSDEEEDEE